jgi:hypothetical protein
MLWLTEVDDVCFKFSEPSVKFIGFFIEALGIGFKHLVYIEDGLSKVVIAVEVFELVLISIVEYLPIDVVEFVEFVE